MSGSPSASKSSYIWRNLDSQCFLSFLLIFLHSTLVAAEYGGQNAELFTQPEPTVRVDAGPIIGTTTSLPAATASVVKFLGVPYAEKTRRFQPPEKPRHWTKPLRTQRWRPACVQQFNAGPLKNQLEMVFNGGPSSARSGNNNSSMLGNSSMPGVGGTAYWNGTGGGPARESEDCLYLNVYAPASASQGRGRAVLMWIFSGSLQFGHSSQPAYDGSSFASYQDVIVVTSNYRTNVFGFPASEELPLRSRNLGFLDQRLALDWVQRNIDIFGGDPDKVTVFGESAGGFSIDALLTSYGRDSRPPFSGAILQSGQISYRGSPINSEVSLDAWKILAKAVGCNTTDTLSCLSNPDISAAQIKEIIEDNSLTFNPVIDNRTLISNPALRRSLGFTPHVPVMIGSNAQEGRIFVRGQNDVESYISNTFKNNTKVMKAVVDAYPVGKRGLNTPYDAIAQIMTEYSFQCSTALWANTSALVGIPTWRYYFNATFPNLQTFPNAGVYHASEIRLIFGTHSEPGRPESTAQEEALSEFMQGAWARFAKDPWAGPGWTGVGLSPSGYDLGNIGSGESSGVTLIKPSQVDSRCSIFTPLYKKVAGESELNKPATLKDVEDDRRLMES